MQLKRNGISGSTDVEQLRDDFMRTNTFRMRGLLDPDLVQFLHNRIEKTSWSLRVHEKISAVEAAPDDVTIVRVLNFALNNPAFLEIIRQVTGFDRIEGFFGRVYRLACSDHYDQWHSDITSNEERLVGVSINLGVVPYEGGLFRLRREATREILCELPNTVAGDAIFLRISAELRHIVTPLEGVTPKTAFAGWFRASVPNYYESLLDSKDIAGTHSAS